MSETGVLLKCKCHFILKDSKGVIHYHTTQLVSTAMEIHIQSFHIYTSSNNQTEVINIFLLTLQQLYVTSIS